MDNLIFPRVVESNTIVLDIKQLDTDLMLFPERDRNFIINTISRYKDAVDPGHGINHIISVVNNVFKYYGYLDKFTRDLIPLKHFVIGAAYHDIGLTMKIEGVDLFAARNIHHLTSELIYLQEMISKLPGKIPDLGDLNRELATISYVAECIKQHRSTVKQTCDGAKFLRCCDALDGAKTVLQRAYDWTCVYHNNVSLEANFKICVDHINHKYLSKNGSANKLPFEWANEEYHEGLTELRSAIEQVEKADSILTYGKYVNTSKNHTEILVNAGILDLDRLI